MSTEPVEVPTAGAADVLVSAFCERCGTWHHLRLVGAPEANGLVKVKPACWTCGNRPLAVVHAVAGTIPRDLATTVTRSTTDQSRAGNSHSPTEDSTP